METDPRSRLRHWTPVDRAVGLYTLWIGILVIVRAPHVPRWPWLVGLHGAILVALILVPPRGADWERPAAAESAPRRAARQTLRFLRHAYPLPVVLVYFEEVRYTIDAVFPRSPYWFEPWLYAADRTLFGALPAVAWADFTSPLLDEIAHAFYFGYYPILVGGLLFAWRAGTHGSASAGNRRDPPGPAWSSTIAGMTFAFLISYLPYPWLPARGPWENPELMANLPEFGGLIFTPLVQTIIDHGAVPGGCFPSVHVAGAWGLIAGLAGHRPRAAWLLAIVAVGMTLSCAYTRYHHGVDLPAGLAVGLLGGVVGRRLSPPTAGNRGRDPRRDAVPDPVEP